MVNSRLLIIVQDRETQFDAPLYSHITSRKDFRLEVYYTASSSHARSNDDELGFPPDWDHLSYSPYEKLYFKNTSLTYLWRLSKELGSKKPSLVLICGYFPRSHLILALLLRLRGVRIGLRSDNTLSHTRFRGLNGFLKRKVISVIQSLFHTWHPVGSQSHKFLRAVSGLDTPSFRFSYSVDNDWFAAQAEASRAKRPSFLATLDWPVDAFIVLGILKWNSREDPLTLIEAFKTLLKQSPHSRLILVGDGPLYLQVSEACAQISGFIHCPGYCSYSTLPFWYAISDIFVHPAIDEPWGVSVNEALACGLPVVAANGVGAASEMLSIGINGVIFENGYSERLADILASYSIRSDLSDIKANSMLAADRFHYRHTISFLQDALLSS